MVYINLMGNLTSGFYKVTVLYTVCPISPVSPLISLWEIIMFKRIFLQY